VSGVFGSRTTPALTGSSAPGSDACFHVSSSQTPPATKHDDVQVLDPNFRIELPNFEGPLDLLLHLIKKHELDILDLPIAFVTEKYVAYLSLMETLNLDVASEYLVMAATLAHIKSKSLLPQAPDDQDDDDLEDELDPRSELIRRLLEYQKYKKAAAQLGARGVAGRDVFPRGIPAPKAEGPAPLAEFSVFKLIDVFQKIVKRRQGELSLGIEAERVSIQERMTQITEKLQARERVPFEELFEGYATTYDLVVTFLALLEMAKMRLMRIYQTETDAPIWVEPRVLAMDDAVANAQVSADGDAPPAEPDPQMPLPRDADAEASAHPPDASAGSAPEPTAEAPAEVSAPAAELSAAEASEHDPLDASAGAAEAAADEPSGGAAGEPAAAEALGDAGAAGGNAAVEPLEGEATVHEQVPVSLDPDDPRGQDGGSR